MRATLPRRYDAAADSSLTAVLTRVIDIHLLWNHEEQCRRNHELHRHPAFGVCAQRRSVPRHSPGARPWGAAVHQFTCFFHRWVHVPLGDSSKEGQNAYLRTFVLRLTVKKMHQSGRDTRLRLLRLVAPRPVAGATGAGAPLPSAAASFQMSSTRMHTMR